MSGFDIGNVSAANLGINQQQRGAGDEVVADVFGDEDAQVSKNQILEMFRDFLRSYQSDDQSEFPYRDQLKAHYESGQFYLTVSMVHLRSHNPQLADYLRKRSEALMPLFSEAAFDVLALTYMPEPKREEGEFQIQLVDLDGELALRKLQAANVSELVALKGIVISAGRCEIKATSVVIRCRTCKKEKRIQCSAGFGGAKLPRVCESNENPQSGVPKCPMDPFMIMADGSRYVDQQRLKLQELPEDVPTGEMPRHISLSVDRYLVGQVKPGTRITAVGLYTAFQGKGRQTQRQLGVADTGIRIPYLRVFGIQQESESSDILLGRIREGDDEDMHKMSQTPDLYQQIANSIAPAMYGFDDVKKSIALQLFGGSRKELPDGMRLRGDINILLLGDPSVGKSQFLKFANQAAPIGVYTSGKGSSAAGLTASVIRDPATGEFHLEGGALVLADGGLVCIDEFDKMREQDRVAIHEAMEQQTISIAKAGITTILNSRTSVLAAANPVFGRYDDMKSPTDNIDFQTTILSRFDLIFILRDLQDDKRDTALAKHVIGVHKKTVAALTTSDPYGAQTGTSLNLERLKKYVAYSRRTCNPRLTVEAAEALKNQYVRFRSDMRKQQADASAAGRSAIPMTVRQLEAVVRLSEALARMELSREANANHVTEAIRLFQVSTYKAATSSYGDVIGSPEFEETVKKATKFLDKRIAIGTSMSLSMLIKELLSRGISEAATEKAIAVGASQQKFQYKAGRKQIARLKQ